MLLEVLIAMLIFALGVLGLVGLQANASKESSMAKYRADATLLANELVGEMWVSDRSYAGLSAKFASATPGPGYTAWLARVTATLPRVAEVPPTVTLTQISPLPSLLPGGATGPSDPVLTSSTQVNITIYWRQPADASTAAPHKLVLLTEIK